MIHLHMTRPVIRIISCGTRCDPSQTSPRMCWTTLAYTWSQQDHSKELLTSSPGLTCHRAVSEWDQESHGKTTRGKWFHDSRSTWLQNTTMLTQLLVQWTSFSLLENQMWTQSNLTLLKHLTRQTTRFYHINSGPLASVEIKGHCWLNLREIITRQ